MTSNKKHSSGYSRLKEKYQELEKKNVELHQFNKSLLKENENLLHDLKTAKKYRDSYRNDLREKSTKLGEVRKHFNDLTLIVKKKNKVINLIGWTSVIFGLLYCATFIWYIWFK